MRAFVITTFALAVALAPAVALAQDAAAAAAPKPPTVAFTTPQGMLLVSIKPDKTAVFEEMITKLKAGVAKSSDEGLKKQLASLKIYKASEPSAGPATLYVIVLDPAVPASEYDLLQMLSKTMTPDELRAPEAAGMWQRYIDVFVTGMNKLSLTVLGG